MMYVVGVVVVDLRMFVDCVKFVFKGLKTYVVMFMGVDFVVVVEVMYVLKLGISMSDGV